MAAGSDRFRSLLIRTGLSSRSGSALLVELAARLGLERELSRGLRQLFSRRPRARSRGGVVVDLATMLVDGGDCVSDLGALAEQPDLFGQVASQSTASRLLHALGEEERGGDSRRAPRRARAGLGVGGAPGRRSRSTSTRSCWSATPRRRVAGRTARAASASIRCTASSTRPASISPGVLRPGNAGANTAADHITVLEEALAQLPAEVADRERDEPVPMLARADAAGATHAFAEALRERRIRFSLGYYVDERVGQAALALPKKRWRPALDADGQEEREGAWVAELTGQLDLSGWPEGTRLIVRKEIPHPGAQLRFTDLDGHRYQCFLTDQARRTTSPGSRRATACTPASRTGSRNRKSSGWAGCPSRRSSPTRPGSSSCCSRKTCSPGSGCSCSRANSRSRNRNGSATASSTSPAGSPAPAAAARCTSPPPGPGATSSPARSTRVAALAPG